MTSSCPPLFRKRGDAVAEPQYTGTVFLCGYHGCMADRATPNLPARDLVATSAFYTALGFEEDYRDDGWMILVRGGITLEFFAAPEVDPASSGASCCLRLDDAESFLEVCRAAGLPETSRGWPRLHPLQLEDSGLRIGALVDLDGTLLRVVQNPPSG